jgi:hypothetical protein
MECYHGQLGIALAFPFFFLEELMRGGKKNDAY